MSTIYFKYGILPNSSPKGRDFFVLNSSNAQAGNLANQFTPDNDGIQRFYYTIATAVAACEANRGDRVFVLEGHIETISAANTALAIAGVQVIGLGTGNNRPVVTFSGVTSSFRFSGANFSMSNIVGTTVTDLLQKPFDVAANQVSLDIEWQDGSDALEAISVIRATGVVNLKINLKYRGYTTGNAAVNPIKLDGVVNADIYIDAYGIVSTAWVNFVTTLCENISVRGRLYTQGITNFTRDVVDTITGSTWDAHIFDASFGGWVSGGSAAALASDDVSAVATSVAAIQTDLGNPSARTNLQTIEAMLGNPDTAGASIYAAIGGAAGLNPYPAGAQAANDVSVAEVVRYAQEALRLGTGGTALANNKSIYDALGSDGATVTDVATSVLGAIGADNANNAFASTNVVGNADGSLLERAEQLRIDITALPLTTDINARLGTDGTSITDSAVTVIGPIGANNANNAFASNLVTADADGSVLERLEWLQANVGDVSGLAFRGATDVGMVGSTTAIVSAALAGYGDDFFNTKYYLQILKNANGVGAAPEREIQQITDYVSATGTFTTNAFTVNVEANDDIMVLHESLVVAGRDDADNVFASTNVVANRDGSVLERLEDTRDQIGTIANTGGTATLGGVLGDVNNVTVATRLTNIGADTDKIDGASLDAAPVAGSLARFVASGGTALGTPLADSKSLVDALGTNGTTVADAAATVLGAIGADNANNAFASTLVVANADGSVLERLEKVQTDIAAIPAGAIANTAFAAGAIDAAAIANGAIDAATFAAGAVDSAAIATGAVDNDAIAADTILGADNANNAFASTLVVANADGSIIEREEYIQDQVNKIDQVSLAASPVAGSLGRFVASGGTALGTALADSKSLVDAIGSTGSALAYGAGSALGAIGTTHMILKTVTSSTITQAGVDMTGVSSGGQLLIEDITLQTNVTGLATGTNFKVSSDNANGNADFLVETVANLSGNKTVDMSGASVSHNRGILETGKKIILKSTVADCTGAGTVTVCIKFRRVVAGATIATV